MGWDTLSAGFAELPPPATMLIRDASRIVISWNDSPDIGFDRAVNPYRGCEHGCVYCYGTPVARLSRLFARPRFRDEAAVQAEVADLLEKELRKPAMWRARSRWVPIPTPTSRSSGTLKLTRAVLQVLDRFNHPLSIVTKSAGVVRDLDILQSLARRNLVRVYVSVTTLDAGLARVMEPRAATPMRRLAAVRRTRPRRRSGRRSGRTDDPGAE